MIIYGYSNQNDIPHIVRGKVAKCSKKIKIIKKEYKLAPPITPTGI